MKEGAVFRSEECAVTLCETEDGKEVEVTVTGAAITRTVLVMSKQVAFRVGETLQRLAKQ